MEGNERIFNEGGWLEKILERKLEKLKAHQSNEPSGAGPTYERLKQKTSNLGGWKVKTIPLRPPQCPM